MASPRSSSSVLVVGSGISGLACARVLHDGGVTVRVVDRGRAGGGRLASKRVDDRPVDIGARYFTVPDGSDFAPVVADWVSRGLARPWTDTFDAITASAVDDDIDDGPVASRERKAGPMRYAAPAGLRSLATDLADRLRSDGVSVEQEVEIAQVSDSGEVGGIRYVAVVLAMPDPQAKRMLVPGSRAASTLFDADGWLPTISIVATWPERHRAERHRAEHPRADRLWPTDLHGAFINDSPVLAFIADDGDRRGDGAPVLVAHTTPEFAREHLAHPDAAIAPAVEAMRALLGIDTPPTSTLAHRWTYSLPAAQHPEPYLLDGRIGVCGDAWGAHSAVPTAWASGAALGHALVARNDSGARESATRMAEVFADVEPDTTGWLAENDRQRDGEPIIDPWQSGT